MSYRLDSLAPQALFRFFEDISAIPRGSGNLKGITAFLCDFAEQRGLDCYSDDTFNVLIKKGGSAGRENEAPLMLQAHTDMVCEKLVGCEHDFLKEGIDLVIDGDFLKADGTTLGGDDGIGVALMLAILDDPSLSHPPLECLFTADEETGMDGAFAFDYSRLSAKRMINLDASGENEITAGCAGGINILHRLELDAVRNENKLLKIEVKGLAGGHSGADIHLGRANATRILARVLLDVYEQEVFNLVSFDAGTKLTAITREGTVLIAADDVKRVSACIAAKEKEIRKELNKDDARFSLRVSKAPMRESCFSYRDTRRLLTLLALVPNGVLHMSKDLEGIVDTSSNVGVVKTEGNTVSITCSLRSMQESRLNELITLHKFISKEFDTRYEEGYGYPGWEFVSGSPIQKRYIDSYRTLFSDKEPYVTAVHAGLECSLMSKRVPGMDAISVGPVMFDIHTPSERLSISSCKRFYRVICHILENA